MKTKITSIVILFVFSLFSGVAQVNMDRWIDVTVTPDVEIEFKISGENDQTPIKIVSGSHSEEFIVGKEWSDIKFTATEGNLKVFGNVIKFNCRKNEGAISELSLSNNDALVVLYCQNNSISQLDLGNSLNMITLDCGYNQIMSLDISKLISLESLRCIKNQIEVLDLSKNVALEEINCAHNMITELDVSNNSALVEFLFYHNQVASLNVDANQELEVLDCSTNAITQLNVKENRKLTELFCEDNSIQKLDLSENLELLELNCSANKLTEIDVSDNVKLTKLHAANNQFRFLILDNNVALQKLRCDENFLERLVLSSTPLLDYVRCDRNLFTACALDSLYETLGNNDHYLKKIIIKKGDGSGNENIGVDSSKYHIATGKHWQVIDMAGNSINNSVFGCSGVGINDQFDEKSLICYPNPVMNELTIMSENDVSSVVIYGISGNILYSKTPFNKGFLRVDFSPWPAGIYFVQIVSQKNSCVKKIIKR